MSEGRPFRCAIYTRKSMEEGLEQPFNTLDAQREAAEAYILSHKQSNWITLPAQYNDGGFSGANIERPALHKLLSDVEAGRVDCVVVYKVDRFSRSLLDFARLMALFERYGVNFVSVTQDLNTTTSMGRLTLNILLSFAQFEREIIGERTRDKMSAARRKGKWTGGNPVLGYDVAPEGGRLVINGAEAEQVRDIFQICLESGTLALSLEAITTRGYRTKHWTSRRGREHSGRPFRKSVLLALLGNVIYAGRVRHKGLVLAGEHEAIVDAELWNKVNERLRPSGRSRNRRPHAKPQAVLAGLLKCGGCGARLIATYTTRQGQRHSCYACKAAGKNGACTQQPVACRDLEPALKRQLERTLGQDPSALVLQQAIKNMVYDSRTRKISIALHSGAEFQFHLEHSIRRGLKDRSGASPKRGKIPRVSRLMALALKFESYVQTGVVRDYAELAKTAQITRARMSQITALLNLAPEIQEQLLFLPETLEGSDPITERQLRNVTRTLDWTSQLDHYRVLVRP